MATDNKAQPKRVNVNLDSALHDRFKAAVAAEGKKMTDVLIDFIKRYVQKSRESGDSPRAKGRD
jgi:hypothetical protein